MYNTDHLEDLINKGGLPEKKKIKKALADEIVEIRESQEPGPETLDEMVIRIKSRGFTI